jgi:hypothetical protein
MEIVPRHFGIVPISEVARVPTFAHNGCAAKKRLDFSNPGKV